jgi:hypothetical protein
MNGRLMERFLSRPSGDRSPPAALRARLKIPALILRSRVSGVSKDAPDGSGASWSILRD